jgi:hypothetical protein
MIREPAQWRPEDPGLAPLFPGIGADLKAHRAALGAYVMARDGQCWAKGCAGHYHSYMHEAIRRSAAQGWKRPWRILIHTPYNCLMLCDLHHETELEPSVMDVAEWMLAAYGPDYIAWLDSLPFIAHPLKGFLASAPVYHRHCISCNRITPHVAIAGHPARHKYEQAACPFCGSTRFVFRKASL